MSNVRGTGFRIVRKIVGFVLLLSEAIFAPMTFEVALDSNGNPPSCPGPDRVAPVSGWSFHPQGPSPNLQETRSLLIPIPLPISLPPSALPPWIRRRGAIFCGSLGAPRFRVMSPAIRRPANWSIPYGATLSQLSFTAWILVPPFREILSSASVTAGVAVRTAPFRAAVTTQRPRL